MSELPPYSVVVATYERPDDLTRLLESLAGQSALPQTVIVVDSSASPEPRLIAESFAGRLPVEYVRAIKPSAAVQRNQGAELVVTPIIAFADDDAILAPDCAEKICAAFAGDVDGKVGGIAPRMEGTPHRAPRWPLRCYYRWQAGYAHRTYGGKLFGPAINCLPTYDPREGDFVEADWLNAGCVFFRTPLFAREKFPEFQGYSFLEDVHLSARIARTHQLFFYRQATYEHRDSSSPHKRNARALARTRMRNQRLVAREIMGLREPALTAKLLLHRLFVTLYLLRRRGPGTWGELLGTWF
jgi:GT2 family glycosyltransferase